MYPARNQTIHARAGKKAWGYTDVKRDEFVRMGRIKTNLYSIFHVCHGLVKWSSFLRKSEWGPRKDGKHKG